MTTGPISEQTTGPITERGSSSGAVRSKLPAEQEPQSLPRLHRPWRGWVALGEVILAGLATWLAFVCWSHVVSTISVVLTNGTPFSSTRYHGNWVAGSIGLGLLALLLVVDAIRQILLAFYARHRPRKPPEFLEIEDLAEGYGSHAA